MGVANYWGSARVLAMKKIKGIFNNKGFTLIEILVVIGIIAILAAIVVVAVNPARQFAEARNSQRQSNVESILNAVGQNIADNKGLFVCAAGTLPTAATIIENSGGYDLRGCIVPTYMAEIPVDPSTGTISSDGSTYNTGYTIMQSATTARITVCAPSAVEAAIAGSAAICVTR